MTKLWPVKVFRKLQVQKQFKFEFRISNSAQAGQAGKFPPAPSQLGSRLGSRHTPGGVDCPVDTPIDLGGRPVWPGAPILAPGSCFVG